MPITSSPDRVAPGPRRPHRVVFLCSDSLLHRHTCATLLRAGVHLVGVVICARPGLRARARFLRRWVARHGLLRTAGQVLGRIDDRLRNRRRDTRILACLVDDTANRATIAAARLPTIRTDSYSRSETIAAMRALDPDIFIVHTKYIVGPSVLRLPPVAVIGGHPGMTPHYRGAYSPFWALLHGKRDMVGYSVFLLDDGIDTGPILVQDRVPIVDREDSHLTIAWKGVLQQAHAQARAIRALDAGESLPLRPITHVPQNSYFGPPTLRDFWRYRRVQQVAR